MPQERSDMRRVKEVLRLVHELGYSLRQTSRSVRLSSTSVRNYLTRAEAAGVRYEEIDGKSEAEIEALLFKQPELSASRPQPDWGMIRIGSANRMKKMPPTSRRREKRAMWSMTISCTLFPTRNAKRRK